MVPPSPLHASFRIPLSRTIGPQNAIGTSAMSTGVRQRQMPAGAAEAGDATATTTYGVFVERRSRDQSQLISQSELLRSTKAPYVAVAVASPASAAPAGICRCCTLADMALAPVAL